MNYILAIQKKTKGFRMRNKFTFGVIALMTAYVVFHIVLSSFGVAPRELGLN